MTLNDMGVTSYNSPVRSLPDLDAKEIVPPHTLVGGELSATLRVRIRRSYEAFSELDIESLSGPLL